jgi:hypothetical protein
MNNKFSVFVIKNMYTNSRLFAFVLIFTIILTIPVNCKASSSWKTLDGNHWKTASCHNRSDDFSKGRECS